MCSSILLKAKRTATKTARRNNRSPVVFGLICVIEQKSSFYRVCAHHFDVVFLFAMHQNRKKYASCGVKLSIIRRQILSSSDRRRGFADAKCSNRATNQKKGARCFRANPNGKKKVTTRCLIVASCMLCRVSMMRGAKSGSSAIQKLTKKNKFHVKQNIRGGRFT